jgi:hypothetical protein
VRATSKACALVMQLGRCLYTQPRAAATPPAARITHQQDAAKHGGAERGLEAGADLQEAAGERARHDRVEGVLLWGWSRGGGVKPRGE